MVGQGYDFDQLKSMDTSLFYKLYQISLKRRTKQLGESFRLYAMATNCDIKEINKQISIMSK